MQKINDNNVIQNYLEWLSSAIAPSTAASGTPIERIAQIITATVERLRVGESPSVLVSVESDGRASAQHVSNHIKQALKTFEAIHSSLPNDEQRLHLKRVLGEALEIAGDYDAALDLYTSAAQVVKELEATGLEGQIHFRAGCIHSQRGNWAQANELLSAALQVQQSVGDNRDMARAQIEMAKIAYRRGEYPQAKLLFQTALEACEYVNDLRGIATIDNHVGIILRMQGEEELASANFHKALIVFQRIQDRVGTAESLNNLGVIHLQLGELGPAFSFFEKALDISHSSGSYPLSAFVYLNKAEYYCEVGDHAMAANMCGCALEMVVRIRNKIGIARINCLLGRIFHKLGASESAGRFYQESMRLYEVFHVPLGVANCLHEYANLQAQQGLTRAATASRDRAGRICRKLGLPASPCLR